MYLYSYTDDREKFLARTLSKTAYAAREVRGLEFNISLDYVMKLLKKQDGRCALTGWPLEFTRGSSAERTNPYVCTMDRIDNNKGYVTGNIRLTCWKANKIRGSLSDSEFYELCESVVKERKKR
jgi:hypothetical protein